MTTFAGHAPEGDAAQGEKLLKGFLRCNNCHSPDPSVTKVGPTLTGFFVHKAGLAEGFNHNS